MCDIRVALGATLFAVYVNAASAYAQDDLAARQRAALKDIRETAADICLTVEQRGQQSEAEISGKVQAKVNGLIAKVAGLDVEGSGRLKSSEYQGVVQSELAGTLRETRNCRKDVFDKLVEKMLPTASASAPPSNTELKQRSKVFSVADFDTIDGSRSRSGHISKIRLSAIDYDGRRPDTYILEWTWSGSGGSQGGSETVIIDLKSADGATLQSLKIPLDRAHCYYPGHDERHSGDLAVRAALIAAIEVSVTPVEGKQDRC